MENRSYILDRLKSKTVSIDEFNYDRLEAPPISAMFNQQDIINLNQIARSLKYAAKPQVKYQEIDKIMRSRGFEKFIAGTNRVVYRPLEDNRFVVKVAADAVGLGDNPREYRNQFIFKPFVTKVFEVTPCGVLGVFERVVPITSREEFLSVAEDIFTVINEWFIGEYVLEDIGVKYFMNYGIRSGFGPVLLDFPYVYKLDGDKLFCNAPSINSPTGCCEGVIDYDPGYNFLYCTKCGVKYKAKELTQAIEQNNVIVKSKGEFKMKVRITGGSKNLNKEVVTGEFSGMAKATPSKPINKQKKLNDDVVENKEENKEVVNDKSVNGVPTDDAKKKVVCPVEFDENLIKKNESEPESFEIFVKCLGDALEIFGNLPGSMKDTANDLICKVFKSQMEKAVKEATEKLEDELASIKNKLKEAESKDCDCEEEIEDVSKDRVIYHLNKAVEIFDKLENTTEDDGGSWIVAEIHKLINSVSFNDMEEIFMNLFVDNFELSIKNINYDDISLGEKENGDNVIKIGLYPQIINKVVDEDDDPVSFENPEPINIAVNIEDIDYVIRNCGMTIVEKADWDKLIENEDSGNIDPSDIRYGDMRFFAAKVMNPKDIDPGQEPSKVIVIMDNDNNYLTLGKDNNIIAIDSIDDRSVEGVSMVSKEWLDNTLKRIKNINDSLNNKSDNTDTNTSTIATGILAPNVPVSVNGVVSEEGDNNND